MEQHDSDSGNDGGLGVARHYQEKEVDVGEGIEQRASVAGSADQQQESKGDEGDLE